ncbi:dihydroorotase [Candidatus Gracilibacteria bacterium]|nr:dihydroorotase [Candidatus Gracilibacteria bacterium]
MSTLIKNGRVIDPANNRDEVCDILIEHGKISKIGKHLDALVENTIDASGLVVSPGFIDMQVHLREPGREDQETIETGCRAALAGGVTSIVCMPNVKPTADNQTVIEYIISKASKLDLARVYPTGAITKGLGGSELAEMNELKSSGAVAVTDDGLDVQDENILRRAMQYAKNCDILLMSHCETNTLTDGGVMHEGWVSTQMGVPGVPAITEDMAVYKNILIAEDTGARLHLLHNSTSGAMRAIREAKARGSNNITAEVTFQHFSLTDEACLNYDTNAKMYPPLRSQEHIDAVIDAINDDTIDAFTTDHAPHTQPDKLMAFEDAPNGFIGLETSLAIANTFLVETGKVDLPKVIQKMTSGPAKILGIPGGNLSDGSPADIAIFNPKTEWIVDENKFFSKGRNSPYIGHTLTGKVIHTMVNGEVKFQDGKII